MIAIYARQSVDKKDSISIETQIEFCKHEAREQKFKVYADKGYSGKNTNRPAFEEMMQAIEQGEITKVVVYRLDRISRSIVDFADFINTLEKLKASFVSATEKFDTSAPMGRAMLYIVVVFAQLERETIAERVKDNYYERVKKGGIGGGPAPYGFCIVRKQIGNVMMSTYEKTEEMEVVKKIFEIYEKPGTSLADIQRYLSENEIKTTSGKSWDNSKLSTVLKSPSYVKSDLAILNFYKARGAIITSNPEEFNGKNACLLVGKRESNTRKYSDVTNHVLAVSAHEGIIPSDTFLYIQSKLSQNKQIKNLHKGKHTWLTGFVKCGYCGYAFSVRLSDTVNGTTAYFYDSGRYLHKICSIKQTHRVADIEKYVEKALIEKAMSIKSNTPKENKVVDKYAPKITEIDSKINHLILTLEESTSVTFSYINQRITELDKEKQELLKKQEQEFFSKKRKTLPNIKDYDNMSFEEKKALTKSLIDKILITKDDVEIMWV